MKLSLADGAIVAGMALLGVGLALWSVPLALVVEGLLLVGGGLLMARAEHERDLAGVGPESPEHRAAGGAAE